MRLIDADSIPWIDLNADIPNTDIKVLITFADKVNRMPTIEPERKTGRWKMEPDPYGFFDEIPVCSECGCTTKMRETYKFCPNCGADMRGEEDDNIVR